MKDSCWKPVAVSATEAMRTGSSGRTRLQLAATHVQGGVALENLIFNVIFAE
jgi:hypothetical protein